MCKRRGCAAVHAHGSGFSLRALKQLSTTTIFQGARQFIPTAQLLNPDKIYEVSGELESFFFITLNEVIH